MRLPKRGYEDGVIVIALVALLLLVGTFFMFGSLNLAAVRVNRDRATNEALARAKEALIAYAVSDANRPGELPCPDVNDDGQLVLGEDFGGGGVCTSLIGRLPWRTLNLPDLRDDSGERLWYAVSADFRAANNVALNNDTAYGAGNTSLRLRTAAGLPAAPDGIVVAIVFAAGPSLQRADGVAQARGCTVGVDCDAGLKCTGTPVTSTPKCNPVNYLDMASGEDNADLLPAANPRFISAERTATFNDRLSPIYSDDIMWLVQRRAANEMAEHLRNHFDAWQSAPSVSGTDKGFYPYAAPFTDPSTPQAGTNGTLNGMIPLTSDPLVWSNPSFGCSVINAGRQLDCNTLIACIFGVCFPNLSARVENVGTRFVDPPQPANVQVLVGLSLGGSATWTLNKAQRRLDFSYGGFVSAGTIHIQVDAPTTSSWLTGSWLVQNNWSQNTYYAIAEGYALDGADSCAAGCLTVSNTAAPTDKEAIVVMTGRVLSTQMGRLTSAPPAVIADYLEGSNATGSSTLVYERNMATAGFNDMPIVVRP